MLASLPAAAFAAILSTSIALASEEAVRCRIEGCSSAFGAVSMSGLALMQQVQQQHQDHITKVVAKEVAVEGHYDKSAVSDEVVAKEVVAEGHYHNDKSAASDEAASTREQPVVPEAPLISESPPASVAKSASQSEPAHGPHIGRSMPSKDDKVALIQSISATSSTQSSRQLGMARLASNLHPPNHKRIRGRTAPLDEPGYQSVAALKSDDEMEMYVRRVIDAYDSKIIRQAGLMSIIPWFSGTKTVQSFEKLQETLLYAVLAKKPNPWLAYRNSDGTTGDNAELNSMGYVEVAATRNEREVTKFARRVCKDLGVDIVDDEGFQRMIKYYSGADHFHDFKQLKHTIVDAAKAPHSWASRKQQERSLDH